MGVFPQDSLFPWFDLPTCASSCEFVAKVLKVCFWFTAVAQMGWKSGGGHNPPPNATCSVTVLMAVLRIEGGELFPLMCCSVQIVATPFYSPR